MTETEELTTRVMRAEARVLALMSVCAAMLKHHPERTDVQTSLGQLVELHDCALLLQTQPDDVADVIRSTSVRVMQLADIGLGPDGVPGKTPC